MCHDIQTAGRRGRGERHLVEYFMVATVPLETAFDPWSVMGDIASDDHADFEIPNSKAMQIRYLRQRSCFVSRHVRGPNEGEAGKVDGAARGVVSQDQGN